MVLTTDTYWELNGVPLNTLAYNIRTWGGDLQAPPPLRGGDITIPYRPGTVFQARRPAGRTLSFDMWVVGSDEDGRMPTNSAAQEKFRANFKKIRNLFWNQGRQSTLVKRWKEPGSSTVYTATAKVVFSGGLVPTMNGNSRATFGAEVYMSDPFFYGDEVTISFSATATSTRTETVLGDYETTDVVITFSGDRNNVRLTNNSEAIYVNVNQNIPAGQSLKVDVDKWTAIKNPGSSESNVIGSVSSFGHEFWFALRPGTQQLTVSSSSGTGVATVKYRPRWI